MDFEKNIELVDASGIDRLGKVVRDGSYRYVCQKCKKPLDRWYSGRWVPKIATGNRSHGYSISQMDAVWISADKMKEKELQAPSLQFFYNYAIGKPYQDTKLAIIPDDILTHKRDYLEEPVNHRTSDYEWITMGIDWGQHYHWVSLMGMKGNGNWDIINLHKVPRSEGVEHIEEDLRAVMRLIYQYEPNLVIADIGFSGNYVDKLRQEFDKSNQKIVYGVDTRTARSNNDMNAHFNDINGTVKIDKLTQAMIMMYHLKAGRIGFWKKETENLDLLIEHWGNVVIKDEQDERTEEYYKSITRKGDDHFAISTIYAMVGMNKIVKAINERGTTSSFTTLDSGVELEQGVQGLYSQTEQTRINEDIY